MEDDLLASIDLIYETILDSTVWPTALINLADTMRTTHIGLSAMDFRAKIYQSIAPRTDPVMTAIYRQYWVFHNPVWRLSARRPAGEVYLLDNLIPREDFAATPVFNEWFRPAKFGLATMSANLLIGDEVSTLIAVANAPGNDEISAEQIRIFKAALPHIDRAVRIHRELRMIDLDHDTAPELLECLQHGVMLVDSAARVLFANAAAQSLVSSGRGLAYEAGFLRCTDGSLALQGLIASCSKHQGPGPSGPGGEIWVQRGSGHSPLRVTVTPLRSKGTVTELPWLSLGIPVAIVTVAVRTRNESGAGQS
ncbi:MAG: hypothetical protein FWC84_05580 [Alphaproteobacteria bacterium]|nr:hypothetical protein [Alphaproteobacteria bacterium]